MKYTNIRSEELEAQVQLVKQIYGELLLYLTKYGWASVPRPKDASDFYSDTEAVSALRRWRVETGRLGRMRHPDRASIYSKLQYYNDPEAGMKAAKKWQKEHPKEKAIYDSAHYWANREKYLKDRKLWSNIHPEQRLDMSHRRRVRLAGARGSHTAEEFRLLCEAYEQQCFYCIFIGEKTPVGKLTEDHMLPITREGSDYIENEVPACKSHNSSKHNKTMPEYLRQLVAEGKGSQELADYLIESFYKPAQTYCSFMASIEDVFNPPVLLLPQSTWRSLQFYSSRSATNLLNRSMICSRLV